MRRLTIFLAIAAFFVGGSGCDMAARPADGFVLPQGSAEEGQEAFVSLGCIDCHRVRDVDLPAPETEGPVMVVLGGSVTKVKSYGELVTSIVNPSHRLARGFRKDAVSEEGVSLMISYNDVMTVTELTDLVTFLQTRYEVTPLPGYHYPVYTYGRKTPDN